MIDLHLHTIFSDGQITDLKRIINRCDIISITDHNTISAYKFFANSLKNIKVIIGCEITVDGAPDYLLYFPQNCANLDMIEYELEVIRLSEEIVIKHCYYSLGYDNWEVDIKRAYSPSQIIRNARTRDLAAIIHLYNKGLRYDNGNFNLEDLKIAIRFRWEYKKNLGNPIATNIAFDIATKFGGQIVLAHPIRTALKRCSSDNISITTLQEIIIKLLRTYALKSGKIIEWEYLGENYLGKYGLSLNDEIILRDFLLEKITEYEFTLTFGTDAHSLKNYEILSCRLEKDQLILQDKWAEWIK